MKAELQDLLDKTIIYKYSLPDSSRNIARTVVSNRDDDCYDCNDTNNLSQLIYNSIIDYSFNEFEIDFNDYSNLLSRALMNRIRYDESQEEATKIKYGFYGEVLLYAILYNSYKTKPIISRGYFYNPTEKSETKGYDSYHLIENDEKVELWFGEVKFRESFSSGVNEIINGLDKTLSDSYLKTNIYALENHRNDFAIKGSKIEAIINSWRANTSINVLDEAKKYNMQLIYPALIVYSDLESDYDQKIRNAVEKINKKFQAKSYSMSLKYQLFFIFLPIEKVKEIKQEVIQCIELKKPLL